MSNNQGKKNMEKSFLLAGVNGNGESYLLILFDDDRGECKKHFKAHTLETMGQRLGEEHADIIEDYSLITSMLPCDNCPKAKCSRKGYFALLPPQILTQLFKIAENEVKDSIGVYLNEGE